MIEEIEGLIEAPKSLTEIEGPALITSRARSITLPAEKTWTGADTEMEIWVMGR